MIPTPAQRGDLLAWGLGWGGVGWGFTKGSLLRQDGFLVIIVITLGTYHGCCCPHRYAHSWLLLPPQICALMATATAAPIDMRTHGCCCPHRYAYSWLLLLLPPQICALMATTAPIDMRTHGYYYPYRYAHSWLLLPLQIYILITTTTPIID